MPIPTRLSTKHFLWDVDAFDVVRNTLSREATRLRQFRSFCPDGRAADLDRLNDQLRDLLMENPPNGRDSYRISATQTQTRKVSKPPRTSVSRKVATARMVRP